MAKRSRYYVGCRGMLREAFRSSETPTKNSHPQYLAVIGPFRSIGGVRVKLAGGLNNPHTTTVADCERIARTNIVR